MSTPELHTDAHLLQGTSSSGESHPMWETSVPEPSSCPGRKPSMGPLKCHLGESSEALAWHFPKQRKSREKHLEGSLSQPGLLRCLQVSLLSFLLLLGAQAVMQWAGLQG
jgi:hypothetical protein